LPMPVGAHVYQHLSNPCLPVILFSIYLLCFVLYKCSCCKVDRSITDGLNTDLHLDIGSGVLPEKVDKFCYLGDMLDADGGCDSAVTASL